MGSTGIATGFALCSHCCQVTVIKNTPHLGNELWNSPAAVFTACSTGRVGPLAFDRRRDALQCWSCTGSAFIVILNVALDVARHVLVSTRQFCIGSLPADRHCSGGPGPCRAWPDGSFLSLFSATQCSGGRAWTMLQWDCLLARAPWTVSVLPSWAEADGSLRRLEVLPALCRACLEAALLLGSWAGMAEPSSAWISSLGSSVPRAFLPGPFCLSALTRFGTLRLVQLQKQQVSLCLKVAAVMLGLERTSKVKLLSFLKLRTSFSAGVE